MSSYTFKTVSEMVDQAAEWQRQKADYRVSAKATSVGGNREFNVPAGGLFADAMTGFAMEDGAVRQLCQKTDVPFDYVAKCPDGLFADNLNHWIQERQGGKEFFVRTHADKVRAVLGSNYSPIDNLEVLKVVDKALSGQPYRLIRPFLSRDDVHLKVIVRNDPSNPTYGFGFYVGNGETGGSALKVTPMIQRDTCTNSIIVDGLAWRQIHVAVAPSLLRLNLIGHVQAALKSSIEAIDRMIEAEADPLPKLTTIVDQIVKRRGYAQDVAKKILVGTEGKESRAGLIHGLSYAAHAAEIGAQETRIRLERDAGLALDSVEALFGGRRQLVSVER